MTDHAHELRRLAQAASHPTTKGRWIRLFGERTVYDRMEDGCRGTPVVSTDKHPPSPFEAACLDFIAAANPAAVSEIIDRLEAAERNLSCCQAEREEAAALFLSVKARLTEERDALRAKIEQMERQEPVATIHINSITGNPSVDFIPGHCYLHHNSSLYALPGAQTQGEEK